MGAKKDQTALRLTLQSNLDFTQITIKTNKIEYIKPGGDTGEWESTKVSASTSGKIYYDFSSLHKFDEYGKWLLRIKLTMSDDRIAYGDWVEYIVE